MPSEDDSEARVTLPSSLSIFSNFVKIYFFGLIFG